MTDSSLAGHTLQTPVATEPLVAIIDRGYRRLHYPERRTFDRIRATPPEERTAKDADWLAVIATRVDTCGAHWKAAGPWRHPDAG